MLASSLIRAFVSSSRYLVLYCETYLPSTRQPDGTVVYGAPLTPSALPEAGPVAPTRGHATAMARTLQEWADRLDAAGIQVHQEGAIARFLGAAGSPSFGRSPGSMDARGKATAFYAACLRGAVELSRCRSFTIPGAPFQGAAIATHEALASAAAFRAADAALTEMERTVAGGRPELQAELEKMRGGIGRHVTMHQTATAEAAGCWATALGPWIQQVQDPAALKPGILYYGVEVVEGSPLLPHIVGNLDPQHGGGVYGFGISLPRKPVAACDAARDIVLAGFRLPEGARFVTDRLDPDAFVAGMILSGRIPPSILSSVYIERKISRLAFMDSGLPRETGWKAVCTPQTVADDPTWGPVGDLCLRYARGEKGFTLEVLEGAVMATLLRSEDTSYPVESAELAAADERYRAAWAGVRELAAQLEVRYGVAVGVDLPYCAGVWSAMYGRAPAGVLLSTDAKSGVRKFSIGVSRDCGAAGATMMAALTATLNRLESGWGGPKGGTILGSPFRGGSSLPLEAVLGHVAEAARAAGVLTAPAAAGRSLR